MKPEVVNRKYLQLQFLFSHVVVLMCDEEGLMTRFESMVECDGMVELPHRLSGKYDGLVFLGGNAVARFNTDDEPEAEEVGGNVRLQEDSDLIDLSMDGQLFELASAIVPVTVQEAQELLDQSVSSLSTSTYIVPSPSQQSAPAVSTAAVSLVTTTTVIPSSSNARTKVSQEQMLEELKVCYQLWAPSSVKLNSIKKYVSSRTDPSVTTTNLQLPFARHSKHCENSKIRCTEALLEICILPYTIDPVTRASKWLPDYFFKETVKHKEEISWKSISVIYTAWNTNYCGWNTPALFFVSFIVGGKIQLSITLCISTGKKLNKKSRTLLHERRRNMDSIFVDPVLTFSPTTTMSTVISSLPPPGSNREKRREGIKANK